MGVVHRNEIFQDSQIDAYVMVKLWHERRTVIRDKYIRCPRPETPRDAKAFNKSKMAVRFK